MLSLRTGDDSMLGKNYESKISTMMPLLNEKQKRIYLASEAIAIGRGGVTEVSRISGISRSVITAGIKDINAVKVRVENRSPKLSRALQKHWKSLCVTQRMAIQCRPCFGPRKASENSLKNW